MIEIKKIPPECTDLTAIDPGAAGGWAQFRLFDTPSPRTWELILCGLTKWEKGERPAVSKGFAERYVVAELPQVQHNDTPSRINNLFKTSARAGHLAESTRAHYVCYVHPHDWKGSVGKELHNDRVIKRMTVRELEVLKNCDCPRHLLNNVIDAIGLGLVTIGRWR